MLKGFALEGREVSIQCSLSNRAVKMAKFTSVIAVLVTVFFVDISAQSLALGRCPKYPPMKKLDAKLVSGILM